MTDQEIIGKIKDILIDEFEVDEKIIKPGSNMYEELELDSLDSVDLVIALETEFGFKIDRTKDEEALRQMRTLNDAVAFIRQKIS